jgi:SAM-dependent methyltransferase
MQISPARNFIIQWSRRLKWLMRMLATGQFRILAIDFSFRVYRAFYVVLFYLVLPRRRQTPPDERVKVKTEFPIAYESPDHLVPWGTMNDNSSNKKFVLHMQTLIDQQQGRGPKAFMDLGCSGGQLVKDFKELGWQAVGLEGSDYSLRHRRANWKRLAGTNLFTADITKPFMVLEGEQALRFDLITAWEVLEHIDPTALEQLFANIISHLKPGGLFVASTTSVPDIHKGVDLHQCKLTNPEWRKLIAARFPELEPIDLHLKFYQYVRYNYAERSFLNYRRRLPEPTVPKRERSLAD